ncbi:hypothetical protein F2Q68_00029683, partial [Brassica cretica]
VQLVRIQMRTREYGWTTQKVFHLLNFVVHGVRAVLFGFHHQVFLMHPKGSVIHHNRQKIAQIFVTAMTKWWDNVNESTQWQDGIFFSLCGAYALVSAIALVQLVRIQMRTREYGWTTQKVFHLLNFVVHGVRAVLFGFQHQVFLMHPKVRFCIGFDVYSSPIFLIY